MLRSFTRHGKQRRRRKARGTTCSSLCAKCYRHKASLVDCSNVAYSMRQVSSSRTFLELPSVLRLRANPTVFQWHCQLEHILLAVPLFEQQNPRCSPRESWTLIRRSLADPVSSDIGVCLINLRSGHIVRICSWAGLSYVSDVSPRLLRACSGHEDLLVRQGYLNFAFHFCPVCALRMRICLPDRAKLSHGSSHHAGRKMGSLPEADFQTLQRGGACPAGPVFPLSMMDCPS